MSSNNNYFYSMTGYGSGYMKIKNYSINIFVKTYNAKYLDVQWNIHPSLVYIEPHFDKIFRKYFLRGRVHVYLTVQLSDENDQNETLKNINSQLDHLSHHISSHHILYDKLNIFIPIPFRDADIQKIKDFTITSNAIEKNIITCFEDVIKQTLRYRLEEGERLHQEIDILINDIVNVFDDIKKMELNRTKNRYNALVKRMKLLLKNVVDKYPPFIYTEMAMLANKMDITEEITRLDVHIQRFRDEMNKKDRLLGRKLNFILQEMQREINTLGAKAEDSTMSHHVIDIKSKLESIKEQIQNIE